MNINPFEILKNAQNFKDKMGSFNERLVSLIITGSAGAGMVEVDLNGKSEMVALRISPEIADDLSMIADLIVSAHNNAQEKVRAASGEQMSLLIRDVGVDISPDSLNLFS